jgi:hypothetical protein
MRRPPAHAEACGRPTESRHGVSGWSFGRPNRVTVCPCGHPRNSSIAVQGCLKVARADGAPLCPHRISRALCKSRRRQPEEEDTEAEVAGSLFAHRPTNAQIDRTFGAIMCSVDLRNSRCTLYCSSGARSSGSGKLIRTSGGISMQCW